MFSQLGVWADCLPPRPQGIIELAFSHALPAHPVLHLGRVGWGREVLRERTNSAHLEGGPLLRGESHLCSRFGEQVSSQQEYWALRNVEDHLVPPI